MIKFDLDNDADNTTTYGISWYRARSEKNDSPFNQYNFPIQGLCSYVFIMPEDAAPGSFIEVSFNGSDPTINKNTQAYVASYYKQPGDIQEIGDKLILYDGVWNRDIPTDATAVERENPTSFYQKYLSSPTTFDEIKDLWELDGDSDRSVQSHKIQVFEDKAKTKRTLFVTIMSARAKSENSFNQIDPYRRSYVKQGGAFEFTIKTNFKKEADLDKIQDELRQDSEDASKYETSELISKLQGVDAEIITLKK